MLMTPEYWQEISVREITKAEPRRFMVYLYYAPECIRKWLAYVQRQSPETVQVEVWAETGAKAKNAAITLANKRFSGAKFLYINDTGDRTAVGRYPELHYLRDIRP
jgi:hypothetical protein